MIYSTVLVANNYLLVSAVELLVANDLYVPNNGLHADLVLLLFL